MPTSVDGLNCGCPGMLLPAFAIAAVLIVTAPCDTEKYLSSCDIDVLIAVKYWVESGLTVKPNALALWQSLQAWPFDAHLLDRGWQRTRGEQSCPTGAMRAIKIEDEEMARLAREQNLEVLKPELGTKPRVYYRNLWRYARCFIGGSVAEERQGIIECVEGASVQLVKDGASVAVTTTDGFGDFKFDRLDENSGTYSIQIFSGGRSKVLQVSLETSINLGEIRL